LAVLRQDVTEGLAGWVGDSVRMMQVLRSILKSYIYVGDGRWHQSVQHSSLPT